MTVSSELYQILNKLKNKTVTGTQFDSIRQAAKSQMRNSVHLWKFKPQIKTLFKMAKYQTYLMLLLGITVLPFTLYQKYQQDKQKLTRILIFTPFAFGACIGPLFMYKKFSKKLIEAISYNFEQKKIVLTRFKDGKQIFASLEDVSYSKSDKGRVKQVFWKTIIAGSGHSDSTQTRNYQIEGLGQWQSVEVFKYLIEIQEKQSL